MNRSTGQSQSRVTTSPFARAAQARTIGGTSVTSTTSSATLSKTTNSTSTRSSKLQMAQTPLCGRPSTSLAVIPRKPASPLPKTILRRRGNSEPGLSKAMVSVLRLLPFGRTPLFSNTSGFPQLIWHPLLVPLLQSAPALPEASRLAGTLL